MVGFALAKPANPGSKARATRTSLLGVWLASRKAKGLIPRAVTKLIVITDDMVGGVF